MENVVIQQNVMSHFFTVYLLSFFEIKPVQAELLIYYATFDSLQNGKKCWKKKLAFDAIRGLHYQ